MLFSEYNQSEYKVNVQCTLYIVHPRYVHSVYCTHIYVCAVPIGTQKSKIK